MIAIVLIGVIGGYLYYSQIIAPSKVPIVLPDIPKDDILSKFKDLKSLDFSVLSNPTFRSLKMFGEVPVLPGQTGRTDLFAPF